MAHSVSLSWTVSTDPVDGYNVLRGTVSGGPYTKVNSGLITVPNFVDNGPFTGLGPFFYVADSVKGTATSKFSNETPAVFLPPAEPTNLQVVADT